jgi:2'-5' RNA ligase
MISFRQFLKSQNEIYSDIRKQQELVLKEGLKPDKNIIKGKSGYLVAFQPDENIAKGISDFSKEVSDIVPAICFGSQNLHTTITTDIGELYKKPTNSILETINTCIESVITELQGTVSINFQKAIYNQNSIILPGVPNDNFLKVSKAIVDCINANGLNFRMPKMAHMTVSRFVGKADKRNIKKLIGTIQKQKPLGKIRMRQIVVGFYRLSKDRFEYNKKNIYLR